MNDIQIFNNPQFGDIRTVMTEENEPFFCLSDICRILELSAKGVNQRLSDEVISNYPITDGLGRTQQALFVNEDGLYDVVLDSRKPEAKAFRKWVTSEVLPSIRKNGGYITSKPDDTPEMIMARGYQVAMATIEKQKAQISLSESKIELLEEITKEQAPKVLFADSVASSEKSILIGELAKILSQSGCQMGQNRLFSLLRQQNYLCTKGESYNIPTQKAMELGLFEIKKQTINQPGGRVLITTTTKVTAKGCIYFVNKFIKSK